MSNSIPDIMKTVTPQADSPTISLPSATTKSVFKTPSLENGGADILKIILIAAIVIFQPVFINQCFILFAMFPLSRYISSTLQSNVCE